jgi:hypothetical protein
MWLVTSSRKFEGWYRTFIPHKTKLWKELTSLLPSKAAICTKLAGILN